MRYESAFSLKIIPCSFAPASLNVAVCRRTIRNEFDFHLEPKKNPSLFLKQRISYITPHDKKILQILMKGTWSLKDPYVMIKDVLVSEFLKEADFKKIFTPEGEPFFRSPFPYRLEINGKLKNGLLSLSPVLRAALDVTEGDSRANDKNEKEGEDENEEMPDVVYIRESGYPEDEGENDLTFLSDDAGSPPFVFGGPPWFLFFQNVFYPLKWPFSFEELAVLKNPRVLPPGELDQKVPGWAEAGLPVRIEGLEHQAETVSSFRPVVEVSENAQNLDLTISFLYHSQVDPFLPSSVSQESDFLLASGKKIVVRRNIKKEKETFNRFYQLLKPWNPSEDLFLNVFRFDEKNAFYAAADAYAFDPGDSIKKGFENLKFFRGVLPQVKWSLGFTEGFPQNPVVINATFELRPFFAGREGASEKNQNDLKKKRGILKTITLEKLIKFFEKGENFFHVGDEKVFYPVRWRKYFPELFRYAEIRGNKVRVYQVHLSLLEDFFETVRGYEEIENQEAAASALKYYHDLQHHVSFLSSPLPASDHQGGGSAQTVKRKRSRSQKRCLRNYQKAGVKWLLSLYRYGAGGILADDMGLGKTAQMISFLKAVSEERLSSRSSKGLRVLVVVPVSIMFNWQREINLWAPAFDVISYGGTHRRFDDLKNRIEGSENMLKQSDHSDMFRASVVVTSFRIVLNDFEKLSTFFWDFLIVDEAQFIKNASSKIFKAVKGLSSGHRFIMTGTPVENSLMELWSHFDLLNPSMLPGRVKFRNLYVKNEPSSHDLDILKKVTDPFILRRKKEIIANELPPKNENTVFLDMDSEQKDFYDKCRLEFYKKTKEDIQQNGIKKSGIHIFERLLRLRQICADPVLYDPSSEIRSVKMNYLLSKIREIVLEGHKILVFSQFTGVLDLIARYIQKPKNHLFDGKNMTYRKPLVLTGQTPGADRAALIDRFQNDSSVKLFLISLKAGGIGLNLTAADYVFIFDPWWNPAGEKQAVDRAHRIGQTRAVMVYRMIVRASVEEHVLNLQSKKNKLAEEILKGTENAGRYLTEEAIDELFS